MSADHKNLHAFVLASTKATLSTSHAVSMLRIEVRALETRLNAIAPATDPEVIAQLAAFREKMDTVFSLLQDRTDALISSLEAYVNG